MTKGGEIIKAALKARSVSDAEHVEKMISSAVGGRHQRPLGDRWGNFGVITPRGSFDHLILELVTNMQDAVIERRAVEKFGNRTKVPFGTPREAARSLFTGVDYRNVGDECTVEFHADGSDPKRSQRVTALFRDAGCGMTPEDIPRSIFLLGSSQKYSTPWLQGAFGLGGEMTYRNAEAVVLVTRRAPALLPSGVNDRTAVAIVRWEETDNGPTAYYLVDRAWDEGTGADASPFSIPAVQVPEFEPGTHLALISYEVEGFHRVRLGDERSFDTVLNTRLFEPLTPVRFSNQITRDRNEYLRGLRRRLADNPRPDRREGTEELLFRSDGTTYRLPVHFYVFSKPGEAGERRKFVAKDHAVVFTSNGQAHIHWTPAEFRNRCSELNKLYDRILVVVETDELPKCFRTKLFTPDRTNRVHINPALRLEEELVGLLNDWDELREINGELIREAIAGSETGHPTIDIAKKIGRALAVKGFSLAGSGKSGGGKTNRPGGRPKPIDLYDDPTALEGPEEALLVTGRGNRVHYNLNAKDDFIPRRARLDVSFDHPEVGPSDIAVGTLRRGRVQISISLTEGVELGKYKLTVRLDNWIRSSGGAGKTMDWVTKAEVVEQPRPGGGVNKRPGTSGAGSGNLVALLWRKHEDTHGWDAATVGDVEMVPARDLAAAEPGDYGELAALGEQRIPTIRLNRGYSPFKRYIAARAKELTATRSAEERYAVGVGVEMLLKHQDVQKWREKGKGVDDEYLKSASQWAARGVLSVLPEYDRLAQEAGAET